MSKKLTCEKYEGSDQCGAPATVRVFPGTSDGCWYACADHGEWLDQHQGPNGTVTRIEYLD